MAVFTILGCRHCARNGSKKSSVDYKSTKAYYEKTTTTIKTNKQTKTTITNKKTTMNSL